MEVQYYPSPDPAKEAIHPDHSGLQVAEEPIPQPPWTTSQTPKRTIFGLRRTTFLLAAALGVVIIAAAVGGGVGGSLAVRNATKACEASAVTVTASASGMPPNSAGNQATAISDPAAPSGSPTAAPSSSPTTSSRLVVPTGILALDCPDLDNQGQQIVTLGHKSWRFKPACGTDYQNNDLGGCIVYSFSDCLQACASHNYWVGWDECVAVHFNANMPVVIQKYHGDCFLKNGTGKLIRDLGNMDVSASLVSSA